MDNIVLSVRAVGEGHYTGLQFHLAGIRTDEYSDNELWERCKEAAMSEMVFPYIVEMPCGATQPFKYGWWLERLPIVDIPCPCGNPNHHIVRFVDNREEDSNGNKREGALSTLP